MMKRSWRSFFAIASYKLQKGCIIKAVYLLLLCLFTFSVGATATAQAAVWYVKTDGSDSNSGISWDYAFANIQAAVDSATDGDEILVKAGTYSPGNQINVEKTVYIYGGTMVRR
jgi:hypothetical protein